MEVDRQELLRTFKIIKGMGNSEVVFEEDGCFGIAYGRNEAFLFGRSVEWGRKLAFLDMDIPIKMLSYLGGDKVKISFTGKDAFIVFASGEANFAQRLVADTDLIDMAVEPEVQKNLDKAWSWVEGSMDGGPLLEIKKLVSTVSGKVIEFAPGKKSGRGGAVTDIRVMGPNRYSIGTLRVDDIGLPSPVRFVADRLVGIASSVESADGVVVSIGVAKDAKGDAPSDGVLRVRSGDFTWYMGTVRAEE